MTVSAIEFSRLGPPKLRLYAMRCAERARPSAPGGSTTTATPAAATR